MTHNYEDFKLDLVKAGAILQSLRDECNMSRSYTAEHLGETQDIIRNIEKGYGALSLERAIKFCMLYEIPIITLVMMLTKDSPQEVRNAILVYDHKNDDATPITDASVPNIPALIPDTVVEAAEAAPAVAPIIPAPTLPEHYSREDIRALLGRMEHAHSEHVADLREQLVRQDQIIRQLLERR